MPSIPTTEEWGRIRHAYESTRRTVEDICHAHGITPNTLRRRARKWNWTMRHPPIPEEGPEAVAPVVQIDLANAGPWLPDSLLSAAAYADSAESRSAEASEGGRGVEREEVEAPDEQRSALPELTPTPTLPLSGGGSLGTEPSPHVVKAGLVTSMPDNVPIAERLQGAVARVLPALETTLAQLAAGPMRPREMEQAARALGSLTRTLRELNGLLSQHQASAPSAWDDDMPEDLDEFRNELARRINAFVESRQAETPAQCEAASNEAAAGAEQH